MRPLFLIPLSLLLHLSLNAQTYQKQKKENVWFSLSKYQEPSCNMCTCIGFLGPLITTADTSYSGGINIYEIDTIYQGADTIWVPNPGFFLYIPAATYYDTTNITNVGGTMVITGGDTVPPYVTTGFEIWDVPATIPPYNRQLRFMQDSVRCLIAGLPLQEDTVLVPLYIYIEDEDDYRIEIDTMHTFSYKTTLIDSVTHHHSELDSTDYIVHIDTGAYINRFFLKFTNSPTRIQRTHGNIVTNESRPTSVVNQVVTSTPLLWNSVNQSLSIKKATTFIGHLEIYNLQGKLIQNTPITTPNFTQQLKLKESGYYIIRYTENGTSSIRKIYYLKYK